mmetsp:Transcript_14384/g.30364  ORF Transcript_14384/g.30364 Transcript_14384/m.30364 type:complete len:209 (+) Transcript_14384:292-918(+)
MFHLELEVRNDLRGGRRQAGRHSAPRCRRGGRTRVGIAALVQSGGELMDQTVALALSLRRRQLLCEPRDAAALLVLEEVELAAPLAEDAHAQPVGAPRSRRVGRRVLQLGLALQRVVPVLNGIVGATREPRHLDNLAPSRADLGDALQNGLILGARPLRLPHVWAQMVAPALAALLSDSSRQEVRGDHGPAARSILFDGCQECRIFIR